MLEDDLKLIADRLRADETKKMVNAVEVGVFKVNDLTPAKRKASITRASRSRSEPAQAGNVE